MILFTKPLCSLCGRARQALQRAKLTFKEVSVHRAAGMAKHAMETCGGIDGNRIPMLKVGEECVYKIVTWVKDQEKESV